MNFQETYSYDDILLVPGYADFLPHEASVATRLGGNIKLNAPILSAAMDTVTEDRMAIALALEGGAGVIHRNLSPQAQAEHVGRVKRYLNWVIENPVVVEKGSTVETVQKLMQQYGVSGLPVVENGKLVGIVTGRDLRFCTDYTLLVDNIMTSKPVVEQAPVIVSTAQEKFNTYKIEKLPVVDADGRLTGLITVKDMEKHQLFPMAAVDENGRLLVGAAVSPNDFDQRIPLLMQNKVDFVVLDTAHGDSIGVLKAVENIKKKYGIVVIGGNVATREGTRRLIEAGADTVKVGVGPGSICTTRIVAGIGMPQFSAVYDCADEASKYNIPVVADGGIKYSGDIVKAIGAGASVVMLGNLFAGVKEAPGREVIYEGRIFKEYRGMGSTGAIAGGSGDRYQMAKNAPIVPEGIEGRVPFKGELKPFLHQLTAGLKKGMGYCGCKTIDELRAYRKFVKITAAGLRESHAHDVHITQEAPNYSRN
ncbi:MAG: IMP dehydrogenase [Spirochaetes bacterium GWB1_48_6]|nr:MAG: IMP dehydrogenase [Spirochaetes bacterium GWB1_48_6]